MKKCGKLVVLLPIIVASVVTALWENKMMEAEVRDEVARQLEENKKVEA